MPRPSVSRSARTPLAAALAALGTVLALFLLASDPATAAGPSLTASQTTGLTSGQTITVNGSGFTPGTHLFLAVCNPAVPAGGGCDMADYATTTANGSGAITGVSIKVVSSFAGQDCTKVSCVLMTNDPSNPTATTNVATLALAFASGAAAPALPKGTDAGQAATGDGLVAALALLAVAVLLLGSGGVLYARRGNSQA